MKLKITAMIIALCGFFLSSCGSEKVDTMEEKLRELAEKGVFESLERFGLEKESSLEMLVKSRPEVFLPGAFDEYPESLELATAIKRAETAKVSLTQITQNLLNYSLSHPDDSLAEELAAKMVWYEVLESQGAGTEKGSNAQEKINSQTDSPLQSHGGT